MGLEVCIRKIEKLDGILSFLFLPPGGKEKKKKEKTFYWKNF